MCPPPNAGRSLDPEAILILICATTRKQTGHRTVRCYLELNYLAGLEVGSLGRNLKGGLAETQTEAAIIRHRIVCSFIRHKWYKFLLWIKVFLPH
jgi:hypothetical protein